MHRTRVKICGICRAEDARAAADAGADAIGLVFYPPSPRAVTLEQAVAIAGALPAFVSSVALFVNPRPEEVELVLRRLRPDLLQFHGDEDAGFCAQFAMPYLKAVRVGAATGAADLLECASRFHSAKALLLDTLAAGVYGGSGESFDWRVVPATMRGQIVLSGGLTPENVGGAVRAVRPWAVDVSSGVEAGKGVKDHRKVAQFIEAVKNADV